MPTTTPETPAPPVTFRLPRPGTSDPYFGFNRSFYYNGELRGWWKLIRLRNEGKNRGVTLVPFQDVLLFVQSHMNTQERHALEATNHKTPAA
jgi:hypothetical protein